MSAAYPFRFQSLPDVTFAFQTGGFFSGWKVLADGEVCNKKGNQIFYTHTDGKEYTILVKPGLDFSAPAFELEGEKVSPLQPLPVYLLAGWCR